MEAKTSNYERTKHKMQELFLENDLDQVAAEYREMGRAMLAGFILLANVTLLLYDRLLGIMAVLYLKKLRPKVFKHS